MSRPSGADARRAGGDRARHHARGLAAARRARACRRSMSSPIRNSCAHAPKRLGLDVPIAVVEPGRRRRGLPHALARRRSARLSRARPGQPDASARRRRSPRSAARSPMSRPARPRPWSPIRSPRTCSTGPASPSPATPNISPSWREETTGEPVHPVMMLWSPELAVVPVTIHLPLQGRAARAHHAI